MRRLAKDFTEQCEAKKYHPYLTAKRRRIAHRCQLKEFHSGPHEDYLGVRWASRGRFRLYAKEESWKSISNN
jgi:hypothetical protein